MYAAKNLLLGSALLGSVYASVANDTAQVCNALWQKYPKYIVYNPVGIESQRTFGNNSEWSSINSEYWNTQNAVQYQSACTFMPANAQMVSDAVLALNQYPDVPFALKGGGHTPSPGVSATDGGLLISFEPNMASTVRTDDGKHFILGIGARWQSVYQVAEQTNQNVVGGRLGHIGVAGLTLGGGLSYLSAQYGLACDNIDQFEVVLANGTATNASRTENSDLWMALRGGSNRFAIVTRMWSQAHPAGTDGKVWGGIKIYSADKHEALLQALANFNANQSDPKAAIIGTFQFGLPANVLELITSPIFFFFYDAATPPENGIFAEFDAIEPLIDDTATQSPSNLSYVTKGVEGTEGLSTSFRMAALPAFANTTMQTEFLKYMYDTVNAQTALQALNPLNIQLVGLDLQPMTVAIQKASQAQGGNMLGINPDHGNRLWIENDYVWFDPLCDEQCPEYSAQVLDGLVAHHKATYPGIPPSQYKSGDIDVINYNPLFLNDAANTQDVYSSYGAESVAFMQKVSRKYDPSGFFLTRQGGFKFPA